MATYRYRCAIDGHVDISRPMGTAPAAISCPICGEPSSRVITAPMIGLAGRARMAVIDHAEVSRSEPVVVSSLPSTPRAGHPRVAPAPRLDPRTSRLPRA